MSNPPAGATATASQPNPRQSPLDVLRVGTGSAGTSLDSPATDTASRAYVTAALTLVMVLTAMEMTVTSTAMPTIIGELHGLKHYSWVASIYLLACTVTMPLYGRLADALGRKRVLLGSIALFAAGSVLASSAHSMLQLILYRGLQGLGAGGTMPTTLTILADLFTLQQRARMQALFSTVWGGASLAGPALGAFLVNTLGWRSIFFVNLPFALLAIAVIAWKYHDHTKPHSTDLDLPGAAALALACTIILALVARLGPDGWSMPMAALLVLLATAAVAYFIRHERRSENPIMPPDLMLQREVGPSILGNFLLGAGFLCVDTYVPLYVQGGRGGGATAAAGVITPVMVTWAFSNLVGAPLLVRWGFRKTALCGAFFVVMGFVGLVLCAQLEAPRWALTVVLAVTGFGFGPCSMSYLLSAQEAVGYHQRGIITANSTFFRSIGGAIGIGLMGGLFNTLVAPEMATLQRSGVNPGAILDPMLRRGLDAKLVHEIGHVISSGLMWVFGAMLGAAVLQLLVTTLMPPRHASHKVSPTEGLEAMGA